MNCAEGHDAYKKKRESTPTKVFKSYTSRSLSALPSFHFSQPRHYTIFIAVLLKYFLLDYFSIFLLDWISEEE